MLFCTLTSAVADFRQFNVVNCALNSLKKNFITCRNLTIFFYYRNFIVHTLYIRYFWIFRYFPNPEIFDPERFSDKEKNSRPAFAYLPFGEGPRNCIGSRFGLMVSKCLLAHILSSMEVSPDPAKELVPLERNKMSFMTQTKHGIDLKIRHLKTTLG